MAIVPLVPDVVTEAGVAATYTSGLSTGNTYTVRNNGKTVLHFKKTGAGICVVTIVANGVVAGHAIAGGSASIPATTGDKFVGPFNPGIFDDVNHDVSFTLSEITGLSVAVLQLP